MREDSAAIVFRYRGRDLRSIDIAFIDRSVQAQIHDFPAFAAPDQNLRVSGRVSFRALTVHFSNYAPRMGNLFPKTP